MLLSHTLRTVVGNYEKLRHEIKIPLKDYNTALESTSAKTKAKCPASLFQACSLSCNLLAVRRFLSWQI